VAGVGKGLGGQIGRLARPRLFQYRGEKHE
jgi:hypothetical protein